MNCIKWLFHLIVSSEGSRQSRRAGESPPRISAWAAWIWRLAGTGTREAWVLHPTRGWRWHAWGDSAKAAGIEILSRECLQMLLHMEKSFSKKSTTSFTLKNVTNYICVTTGTSAALHRGPGFAQHTAGQSRTGHSLGSASDRRPSAGDPAARMEAVPGTVDRHPDSAQ